MMNEHKEDEKQSISRNFAYVTWRYCFLFHEHGETFLMLRGEIA